MANPEDRKSCFVICPISEDNSPVRKRSDRLMQHVIQPVTRECGYETKRSDLEDKPGRIPTDIILHLLEDGLVIADLTDRNPNVFYELGVRHATGKPTILMIEKTQEIPFDIGQERTIHYDEGDWDSIDDCKSRLRSQIESIETNPKAVKNPVSEVTAFQSVIKSGDPEEKTSVLILSMLQDIRSEINELARQNREIRGGPFSGGLGALFGAGTNLLARDVLTPPLSSTQEALLSDVLDREMARRNVLGSLLSDAMKRQEEENDQSESEEK